MTVIMAIAGVAIVVFLMGLGPTSAEYAKSRRSHDRDPY